MAYEGAYFETFPGVWRHGWRTFARSVRADAVFDALVATPVDESDEVYLLAPGGDNVKVRHGLVDVKVLRETDATGLQRWEPILKAPFPLDGGRHRPDGVPGPPQAGPAARRRADPRRRRWRRPGR